MVGFAGTVRLRVDPTLLDVCSVSRLGSNKGFINTFVRLLLLITDEL